MIVFFSSAGLLGAFMVLLGDIGEFEWKVLSTTFSLGWYSLLGIVCSTWMSDTQNLRWISKAGLFAAGFSAVTSLILVWAPVEGIQPTLARVFGTSGILAFAIPHGLIVFSHEREPYESIAQILTFLAIIALSVLGTAVFWELFWISGIPWRLLGFLAIIDIAGTVVSLLIRCVK